MTGQSEIAGASQTRYCITEGVSITSPSSHGRGIRSTLPRDRDLHRGVLFRDAARADEAVALGFRRLQAKTMGLDERLESGQLRSLTLPRACFVNATHRSILGFERKGE